MNGAFGVDRYGFSSTERTLKSLCSSRRREAAGQGLVDDVHVVSLGATVLVEVAARRDTLTLVRDERPCEPGIGREVRLDVPVARRHEADALPLTLDDEPGRGALHSSRRQPRVDLLPKDRRHLVAVEPVEDAPGLGRVDEPVVDATWAADRLVDRGAGDLVEDHPLHGHAWLQRLEEVPGDRFALAVFVGGEVELVGVLERGAQLLHDLFAAGGQLIGRLEPVVDVDGKPLAGQIGHVPNGRAHLESVAEEARDRLRLRGRLDDDEGSGHRR